MSATSRLTQVVFKLSSSELSDEINLKPEAWRILSQVNGVRTLGEIAQAVGMSAEAASQIAETLLQARILEVAREGVAQVNPNVDEAFFQNVARELARAIGPLADIILEDTIAAFGETRASFPRARVADLVERVSEEIPDAARRLRFQQAMLSLIR